MRELLELPNDLYTPDTSTRVIVYRMQCCGMGWEVASALFATFLNSSGCSATCGKPYNLPTGSISVPSFKYMYRMIVGDTCWRCRVPHSCGEVKVSNFKMKFVTMFYKNEMARDLFDEAVELLRVRRTAFLDKPSHLCCTVDMQLQPV